MTEPHRRTIRRFAHELFPHAREDQTRPLDIEVPYLYARMAGMRVLGSDWFDLGREHEQGTPEYANAIRLSTYRTLEFIDATRIALLADALAQGMAGDQAWAWADERVTDDMEVAWDRASAVLGIDLDRIKPYPIVGEPEHHDHLGPDDGLGWRKVTRIAGKESDCEECTEPCECEEANHG